VEGVQVVENRRGDVVRKVAKNEPLLHLVTVRKFLQVGGEDVGFNYDYPRIGGSGFPKARGQPRIDLDCDHASDPFGEQRSHRAVSGADFQHRLLRTQVKGIDNAPPVTRAGKEMLSEFWSVRLTHRLPALVGLARRQSPAAGSAASNQWESCASETLNPA